MFHFADLKRKTFKKAKSSYWIRKLQRKFVFLNHMYITYEHIGQLNTVRTYMTSKLTLQICTDSISTLILCKCKNLLDSLKANISIITS